MGDLPEMLRATMRGPTVPPHAVRWSTSDAVLVLLGAQILSFLWGGIVVVGAYGSDIPAVLPIAVSIVANVGLWVGYGYGPVLVARSKGEGAVADYGVAARPPDVWAGIVAGVGLQLLAIPALYWPLLRFVDADPGALAQDQIDRIDGAPEWALFAFSVVVIAPVVEELFFRGLFLRALEGWIGTGAAIAVSSGVFALVHREPIVLPGLFVFGLVAAALTVRTGRLGPAVALHMGFNATTLVVLGL